MRRHDTGVVDLRYVLRADLTRVRLPGVRPSHHPSPTDELWRHTCFEMFVHKDPGQPGPSGLSGSSGYYELNISPSGQWALYSFDAYHRNMTSVMPARPPRVRVDRAEDRFEVQVRADFGGLPCAGTMAVCAVVEDTARGLAYWAVTHPSAEPDFHHAGGFVIGSRP